MDGSNVCDKHLRVALRLHLWLIPHEPVLLITGDDIDHNTIGFTQGSLHMHTTIRTAKGLSVEKFSTTEPFCVR